MVPGRLTANLKRRLLQYVGATTVTGFGPTIDSARFRASSNVRTGCIPIALNDAPGLRVPATSTAPARLST